MANIERSPTSRPGPFSASGHTYTATSPASHLVASVLVHVYERHGAYVVSRDIPVGVVTIRIEPLQRAVASDQDERVRPVTQFAHGQRVSAVMQLNAEGGGAGLD